MGLYSINIESALNKPPRGHYTVYIKPPSFSFNTEYWNKNHLANVCFITYEDMKRDLPSVIRKVSSFLGKPVPEEKMAEFCDHLSFDKMKNNKAVNKDEFVKVSQYFCSTIGKYVRALQYTTTTFCLIYLVLSRC